MHQPKHFALFNSSAIPLSSRKQQTRKLALLIKMRRDAQTGRQYLNHQRTLLANYS